MKETLERLFEYFREEGLSEAEAIEAKPHLMALFDASPIEVNQAIDLYYG